MSARSQAGYLAYRARQRYRADRREVRRAGLAVILTEIPVVVLNALAGGGLLFSLVAGLSGLAAGAAAIALVLLFVPRRRPK